LVAFSRCSTADRRKVTPKDGNVEEMGAEKVNPKLSAS